MTRKLEAALVVTLGELTRRGRDFLRSPRRGRDFLRSPRRGRDFLRSPRWERDFLRSPGLPIVLAQSSPRRSTELTEAFSFISLGARHGLAAAALYFWNAADAAVSQRTPR